jgi:hypothetical protein
MQKSLERIEQEIAERRAEQRFELTKSALAGLCANKGGEADSTIAARAVSIADQTMKYLGDGK